MTKKGATKYYVIANRVKQSRIRALLNTPHKRHCEGDNPKQSIVCQYSGFLHYVRNDVRFILDCFVPRNDALWKHQNSKTVKQ